MKLDDIDPADIAATTLATADYWTDIPEAKPRQRCRVKAGTPDHRVVVTRDGRVHAGSAVIFDETYEHIPGYKPGDKPKKGRD